MSVTDTDPPVAPARSSCPHWCDGTHENLDEGIEHRGEVGRVGQDSGELMVVLAIVSPTPNGAAVEMEWLGAASDDTGHYLMESIEFPPEELAPLADLFIKANRMLEGS